MAANHMNGGNELVMAGFSSSAPDKTGIVADEASTRSDAPVKVDNADLNEHDAAPAEAPKAEQEDQQQQQQQPKLTAAEVMAQLDAQREQQEKAFAAKYKVEKFLGNGAFGVVSLCTRLPASDPPVFFACKDISLLKNKDTQRRREFIENEIACLGNAAGHFAIVKLHDVFPRENNTKWTLILDFADGGELAEQVALRRANGTSFSESEILHIMVQLLLALEHLHTKRILHRDIKAQNVLLSSQHGIGRVMLSDLGLSRQFQETLSAVAKTRQGSPCYMAPEIWKGQRYGRKADVFSLGTVLFELVTLQRPYAAASLDQLGADICNGVRTVPDDKLPESKLRTLCLDMLSPDPARRPSAQEILASELGLEMLRRFERRLERSNDAAVMPKDVKEGIQQQLADAAARRKTYLEHVNFCGNAPSVLPSSLVLQASGIGAPAAPAAAAAAAVAAAAAAPPVASAVNRILIKAGPLIKQSDWGQNTWVRRFLRLSGGVLVLTESDGDEKCAEMRLEDVERVVPLRAENAAGRAFVFTLVTTSQRVVWFQAKDEDERTAWVDVLNQAMCVEHQ